jgi:hypothetical protein
LEVGVLFYRVSYLFSFCCKLCHTRLLTLLVPLPDERIVVYHKEVSEKDFNNSLKRSLIWCESITIGLLKPLFQDDISDVFDPYTNTGTLRRVDEDIDDMDEDSF